MTRLSDRGVIEVDLLAWQRELGKTAFHIGSADRDYSVGEVFRALDIGLEDLRQRIADEVLLPDIERLEAPPSRDGPTQVYVVGTISLEVPSGEVLTSDFSEDERRYTYIGEKTDDTMDVAPIETL
jgi:hypothetical protein